MSEHDARDPFVGINQHIRKEARGQYVPAYAIGKVISTSPLVIRADGTEKAGNPAGALSGVTYDRPDSTYGPFNWTVTEGGGKLETAEDVNVNGTRKNVAY